MIDDIFLGEDLQVDYCKLYPCLDLPYTVTREWKQSGKWKPIAENDFVGFLELLTYALSVVPPWVRINRVQRDFPEAQEKNNFLGFVSDNIRTNLQQMVHTNLERQGKGCYDIRTREVKNQFPSDVSQRARFYVRCYRANHGTELFLTVELPSRTPHSVDDAVLLGILRLRFTDYDVARVKNSNGGDSDDKNTDANNNNSNNDDKNTDNSTTNENRSNNGGADDAPKPRLRCPPHYLAEFAERPQARIRELHVYGVVQMVNTNKAGGAADKQATQHTGVGKFLMSAAERISRAYGFYDISVISGVGVREYYAGLGYTLQTTAGEYMVKNVREERRLLPLSLFGNSVNEQDILGPVARFGICQKFMPQPQLVNSNSSSSSSSKDVAVDKFALIHSYPHIQEGRAQVAVINVLHAPGEVLPPIEPAKPLSSSSSSSSKHAKRTGSSSVDEVKRTTTASSTTSISALLWGVGVVLALVVAWLTMTMNVDKY